MPPYRRFRLNLHRHTQTMLKNKSNQKFTKSWLIWVKLSLSASVPLMIAIFTIVSYVQQMQIDEHNRQQDEELAIATREKDISIANLTRIQDHMIANITRYHDLEIANLTQIKDWEIAMANLNIANETKMQDRQIAEDNRKEDRIQQQDLHYETLYSKYIDDISTILYKEPHNQTTFTNEEKKMLYIRRKTLITLRTIDSERRSQLFVFLYENNLLPDQSSPLTTISLMGADLRNITIKSPLTGSYEFNSLTLQSLNLMNAVFSDCRFRGGTNFSGSILTNVQFIGAVFEDNLDAYKVKLINASFTDCIFKKKIIIEDSDLRYAKFIRSNFEQLSFVSINFTNGSFINCKFSGETNFKKSFMNGVTFTNSEFETNKQHEFDHVSLDYSYFNNMSLANTTFQYSNLSYTDLSNTHLGNVQFTSKILLINSIFYNTNFTEVNFTHVNLSGARINMSYFQDSQLYNVILPNGTWLINHDNLLKNGNAEKYCWWPFKENILTQWKEEIDAPILYHHNITQLDSTNSSIGNCSFACTDRHLCSMRQLIELKQFILFIDSNELEYTVSAYFGSNNECEQGLISIWIVSYEGRFKRQLRNPYIKSSTNFIKWQQKTDTYKLSKMNGDLYYIRITFNKYSTSCYVDNIEFHLRKSSIYNLN
ncbi:unnamed protein product [Adineta steineri]|uniref:Pentapeptide repeat-containing protein n=1 Tax=Adineta steineri TaxID=433720 RepID=A0A815Q7I1_9BILA|nr:unnamed protein product [Adineta steineri]CAF1632750.1 unnamed protein product [Adineta steineri]